MAFEVVVAGHAARAQDIEKGEGEADAIVDSVSFGSAECVQHRLFEVNMLMQCPVISDIAQTRRLHMPRFMRRTGVSFMQCRSDLLGRETALKTGA